MNHGVFKRLQEILLKFEMREFLFLQEPHRQLAQRVQSKEANMRIIVTTNLKGICKNLYMSKDEY
jgi:hypothetical protein